MQLVAKSDLSTGNTAFASYVLRSHDLVRCLRCLHSCDRQPRQACPSMRRLAQVFALTAPYSTKVDPAKDSKVPVKWYSREAALKFQETHGLGVRAVGALIGACMRARSIPLACVPLICMRARLVPSTKPGSIMLLLY